MNTASRPLPAVMTWAALSGHTSYTLEMTAGLLQQLLFGLVSQGRVVKDPGASQSNGLCGCKTGFSADGGAHLGGVLPGVVSGAGDGCGGGKLGGGNQVAYIAHVAGGGQHLLAHQGAVRDHNGI